MFNGHINGRLSRLERACPSMHRARRIETCPHCSDIDPVTRKGTIGNKVNRPLK